MGPAAASSNDQYPRPCRGRPAIGYLTPWVDDNVSQSLWSGVVDAAREQGVNLVCFVGESLRNAGGNPSPANVAYDLLSSKTVDGLISWASSLGGALEYGEIVKFHQRYRPLPIVSITLPMEGIPTVLIDSYQGMRDMVAHLIEVHDCRRVVFIRGPEAHYSAQERYRAYSDALDAYGIALDPNLVTAPGGFASSTGVEGICWLLDERNLRPRVDFDAIVTVSDLPALGVLRELQARGIQVPEDVALAGVNDVIEGRFVTPPLTSVRLPFYEQGRRAVETLLALLAGEPVPERVVLPAELQVRRSCGCLLPAVAQAAAVPAQTLAAGRSLAAAIAGQREDVLEAMAQAVNTFSQGLDPDWAAQLFDLFAAEVVAALAGESVFLYQLDLVLRRVVLAGGQVEVWQRVLSTLRYHMLSCFGDADTEALARAENLWGQARVLVGETVQRARGYESVRRAYQTQTLRQISQALVATFDVPEVADLLSRELPRLGIQCCYLALYEDPRNPTGRSRLILGCDKEGRIALKSDQHSFLSDQLVPIEISGQLHLETPCGLIVEPLYFREEQIGFVLFGIGPRDGAIYEVLRGQLSSSLKGALLFDETRKARAVAEKADQLKTRLLANVSHELRTPLNVILGCARDALSTPSPYRTTLPEGLREDIAHIYHSAEHQLRVINDLLDLSRAEIDELDLYLELLPPRPLLEEVFTSMADADSSGGIAWHLELPERLPMIQADPVRLRQIMLNLLSNAAKFVESGRVVLGAEATAEHLHIWVQDTGPGIPVDMQECIFEPFITVGQANRRLEGVGLGLSITRRLVALHRGSMELESQPGQGSTFHVYLPLPALSDRPSVPPVGTCSTLLLISSHDQAAADIVEFSQRQGLEIYRLQASDDLDAVMQRVRPAALAWDLTDASSSDWGIVRRLRNHPRLSQMPFILYGRDHAEEGALSIGLTDFVIKPLDGNSLMEAINGICPPEEAGPILIVDDDPQIRTLYQEVVGKRCPGYTIRTAADGVAALACMAEETPSLVILDLLMPEMDGFDVLDWMRATERTRQVPVLILSGRVLTLEDVKRIERHARVTLQSKGILSAEEIAVSLHRILFGTESLPAHTSALVKRAVAYFHQHYDRPLSRWKVAAAVDVSEDYLSRVFRQELDISPWEYLTRYRIRHAMERLRSTSESIGTVAHRVGFKDPAYFSRVFRRVTGMAPIAYRRSFE